VDWCTEGLQPKCKNNKLTKKAKKSGLADPRQRCLAKNTKDNGYRYLYGAACGSKSDCASRCCQIKPRYISKKSTFGLILDMDDRTLHLKIDDHVCRDPIPSGTIPEGVEVQFALTSNYPMMSFQVADAKRARDGYSGGILLESTSTVTTGPDWQCRPMPLGGTAQFEAAFTHPCGAAPADFKAHKTNTCPTAKALRKYRVGYKSTESETECHSYCVGKSAQAMVVRQGRKRNCMCLDWDELHTSWASILVSGVKTGSCTMSLLTALPPRESSCLGGWTPANTLFGAGGAPWGAPQMPPVIEEKQGQLAESKGKFEKLGPGCCENCNEKGPFIFNDHLPGGLDACMAQCRAAGTNCGYVSHGWSQGTSSWCSVYPADKCKCELDTSATSCGAEGGNTGVATYKFKFEPSAYWIWANNRKETSRVACRYDRQHVDLIAQSKAAMEADRLAAPREFDVSAAGTVDCPAGFFSVQDAALCMKAVATLQLKRATDYRQSKADAPTGCYTQGDVVHINLPDVQGKGVALDDAKVICVKPLEEAESDAGAAAPATEDSR
jgi:hypothetical protein